MSKSGGSPQSAQKVRAAIVARAEKTLANGESYAFEDRNSNFPAGSYKCNKFVCDVANAAGANISLNVDQDGNAWPSTAGMFGMGKATWKGRDGFKAFVWSSVIAYNLKQRST